MDLMQLYVYSNWLYTGIMIDTSGSSAQGTSILVPSNPPISYRSLEFMRLMSPADPFSTRIISDIVRLTPFWRDILKNSFMFRELKTPMNCPG